MKCKLWKGLTNGSGYGTRWRKGQSTLVHRQEWECRYGKIPEGMEIRHRCLNRLCINVRHMSLSSHSENMKDNRKVVYERVIRLSERLANIDISKILKISTSTVCRILKDFKNKSCIIEIN